MPWEIHEVPLGYRLQFPDPSENPNTTLEIAQPPSRCFNHPMRRTVLGTFLFVAILGLGCIGVAVPGIREVLTVDALRTIALLMSIEALYPAMRLIHVFLDNARYHHAKFVRDWLAQPERRIKRYFVPPHCPHLNPIEHLWGPLHRNLTHNRCYAAFNEFCYAMLGFLKEDVPRNWGDLCDDVSDNFRVISPKDFWALT